MNIWTFDYPVNWLFRFSFNVDIERTFSDQTKHLGTCCVIYVYNTLFRKKKKKSESV